MESIGNNRYISLKTVYAERIAPCGKIRGIHDHRNGLIRYLGVRYAVAERFCPPVEVTRIEGAYTAAAFGDCCPQFRTYHDESKNKDPLWYNEFRKGLTFTYSEDCLNLNIYTPEKTEKCPVLIFIHGGSFVKGSSSERQYDGKEYCKRGVILVTFNYRLNIFGFFADNKTANLALMDQLCAIEWVRHNIEAFGGDPDNITLFGQSAGAMCIQALISGERIRGKINGAVMLSGGGCLKGIFAPHSRMLSKLFYRYVKRVADARDTQALKELTCEELFYAYEQAGKKRKLQGIIASAPVFDGRVITKKNFRKQKCSPPCLISVTKDDMTPGYLRKSALRYAKKSGQNCHLLLFSRDLPGDNRGAWHSSDLWYAFGTLENSPRPFEERDRILSDRIIDNIAHFAKTHKTQDSILAFNKESGGFSILD